MLKIKKGKPTQTIYPGIYYAILATPEDSLPGDKKPFYIVNVIDYNEKGARAYAVQTIVMGGDELREGFGLKKREIINVIKA